MVVVGIVLIVVGVGLLAGTVLSLSSDQELIRRSDARRGHAPAASTSLRAGFSLVS
jgi:hypothetical protein